MASKPKASHVRRALRDAVDPERGAWMPRFFKTGKGEYGEGDRFYGVAVPDQRRITKKFRGLGWKEIETLLGSQWHEQRLVALLMLVDRYDRGDAAERDKVFRFYVAHLDRVNNWDLVDVSAPQIVGRHLFGGDDGLRDRLARSKHLWSRRVAIVSTQWDIRQRSLAPTYRLAEILMHDHEDLIHKATGWMLREAGKRDTEKLNRFLKRHAGAMPRTMLRYAIEKFTPRERRQWLDAGR